MRILLVEDDQMSRKAIAEFLAGQLGHDVRECENGSEALKIFKTEPFPLVVSDIRMPGVSGIDLTNYIKKLPGSHLTDIVLITGYGNMDSAIKALRAGAYDYLLKPIDVEELALVITRVEEHLSLVQENLELKHHFDEKVDEATHHIKDRYSRIQDAYNKIVGIGRTGFFSEIMKKNRELAEKLHRDRSIPVLIEGETGTGKEIIARLIHYGSGEVTTPFISINCTAISPNLFETELFGYEEGAFTGAKKRGSIGKFELAQGGTIFLDEIGDLPLDLQPKLLRVLEEKEFYRVGGLKKSKLNIRIICATNQDLLEKVSEGKFRQDLFYRLKVGHIIVPPLRKRKEEIMPLARMFLSQLAQEKKKRFNHFHEATIKILEDYNWPGNIRELKNAIESIVLLYDDTEILPEHLFSLNSGQNHSPCRGTPPIVNGKVNLPEEELNLKELEREIVRAALEKFDGNKTQTARYLGMTRSALRSKIKDLM
jgi:two-component system response regulator AtoC